MFFSWVAASSRASSASSIRSTHTPSSGECGAANRNRFSRRRKAAEREGSSLSLSLSSYVERERQSSKS